MSGIDLGVADGIQTIRLNRPDKKNAISAPMYRMMTEALLRGDAEPDVRVHLFCGLPGLFTAGNDLADFAAGAEGAAAAFAFVRSLPLITKPMIAAVDGTAIGIGTTLLFHCDLVYATPSAVFITPFLDLGLVPEAASSLLAPARMGHARAFELLVLGVPFDAEKAKSAGLVNEVVHAGRLEELARASALRIAGKPPEALSLSRRLLRPDPSSVIARIDEEAALFQERLESSEARAAFAAFFAKPSGSGGRGGA